MNNFASNNSQCKSLWIGEVESWMDENYLQKCIGNYKVDIKNIKLIRDKTSGQLLGYGFLEFDTTEEAENALNVLNRKQMSDSNKLFKLNWATYSSTKSTTQNANENSLYVSELDPSVKDDDLRNFFAEKYQSVLGAKIIVDPTTKISKGYGFVKFGDNTEYSRALTEMNGQAINGKPMKINVASYKKGNYDAQGNKKGNMMGNSNQGYTDPYNQMNGMPMGQTQQQGQDQTMNMYNQTTMNAMQNYYNQYYMTNGYYPPYNMNQLYYQMYMNAQYYNPQNQVQPQINNQEQSQQQESQAVPEDQ